MSLQRERHIINGNVQGVGFRPFIYTTALACNLTGFVQNTDEGVRIEVQGTPENLALFNQKIHTHLPPLAFIISHQRNEIPPLPAQRTKDKEKKFTILESVQCGVHKGCATDGKGKTPPKDAGKKHTGHNVFIGPDVGTCEQCLAEIFDPAGRRYLYPFTNCTNCGPRYSIIRSIPYDRSATSMACFPMCDKCRKEYSDPSDRRFHAQPNACEHCGPQVWYVSAENLHHGQTAMPASPSPLAITQATRLILEGKTLALKGLGGFHLVCLAFNEQAIATLREHKQRPHKPFALMTATLQDAQNFVTVSAKAASLLSAPARPIVLCPKLPSQTLSPNSPPSQPPHLPASIAPDTDFLGIMLPYTPLHHILMAELKKQMQGQGMDYPPVVIMTSGNRGGEPICLENREALEKLHPFAHGFLLHNRDILIRVDDSVLAPLDDDTSIVFRRARGFAPLPLSLPVLRPHLPQNQPQPQSPAQNQENIAELPPEQASKQLSRQLTTQAMDSSMVHPTKQLVNQPVKQAVEQSGSPLPTPTTQGHALPAPSSLPALLGLGAELKNTICLNKNAHAFISQHLGDMQHMEATNFHDEIVAHFQKTLELEPEIIIHDKHPNYYTTQKAKTFKVPRLALQHHAAHAFALLGENAVPCKSLVLALDGTGYGDDGTLWGGEALVVDMQTGDYTRLGAFSPLFLPGGEAAIGEPWRIAHALCLKNAIDPTPFPWLPLHAATAQHIPLMLSKGINTPLSTSCGRLFDAVSALLGQGISVSYEGQAAIRLERLARTSLHHKNKTQVPLLPCPFFVEKGFYTLDTDKLFMAICEEIEAGQNPADIALSFHESLITGLAVWAKTLCASHNLLHVGLTGGCFNNGLLLQGLKHALTTFGLQPVVHGKLPCGDGNIAYGQVVWGAIMAQKKRDNNVTLLADANSPE